MTRNQTAPSDPATDRLSILRDPNEPQLVEQTLGEPRCWAWEDPVTAELHLQERSVEELDAAVDTWVGLVEDILDADRSLGGAVDYAEAGPPSRDPVDERGIAPTLAATVTITLSYCSARSSG